MISAALSLALCCFNCWLLLAYSSDTNRILKSTPEAHPRILCFYSSMDTPFQYIPVMNCIFAAQRNVSIFWVVNSHF